MMQNWKDVARATLAGSEDGTLTFPVLCVKFCKGGHGWLELMRLGGAGFSCAL